MHKTLAAFAVTVLMQASSFVQSATPTPEELDPWEQKDAPDRRIGETFEDGDFSFVVTRAFYCSSMTDSLGESTKAPNGALFVVVFYTVRNNGKETVTIPTNDFTLVDSGDEYSCSSDGLLALAMMNKGAEISALELHPKISKETSTVFEVPTSETKKEMRLLIPAAHARPTVQTVRFTPKPYQRLKQ
jgi:hypothetical protein